MLPDISSIVIFVQIKLDLSTPRRAELKQSNICPVFRDVEAGDKISEELSNLCEMAFCYASRTIDQEKHVRGLHAFHRRNFYEEKKLDMRKDKRGSLKGVISGVYS